MCDRHRARAETRRGGERSHPPWSPRPRNAHEGPWNGLNPAGYKLVRRVPHARKGLALDRNETTDQTNVGATNRKVFAIANMMLRMWAHPQALRLRRTASRLRG